MGVIKDLFLFVLKFFKTKPGIAFFIALLIPTAICVLCCPHYIAIPGSTFAFNLPAFKYSEITFEKPVYVKHYEVNDGEERGADPTISKGSTYSLEREQTVLTIENTNNSITTVKQSPRLSVNVLLGPTLNVQISKISVDGKPVNLDKFNSEYLTTKGELVQSRYIRKYIADLIFKYNDLISNWILTAMFFYTTYAFTELFLMKFRTICSVKCFEKYLVKRLHIKDITEKRQREDALNKFRAKWWQSANRQRFLQALGPALGFIMTVSSLVQALHPSLITAHNLDGFLNGIHVAMIATFLGLGIRLIALQSARVNDQILKRVEQRLEPN